MKRGRSELKQELLMSEILQLVDNLGNASSVKGKQSDRQYS